MHALTTAQHAFNAFVIRWWFACEMLSVFGMYFKVQVIDTAHQEDAKSEMLCMLKIFWWSSCDVV